MVSRGRALPQKTPEHVLLQVAEDDVHRLQMLLRLVFGGEQQHDAVNRLVIERGKVNSVDAAANRSNHFLYLGVLHVRNGDALAEAGGAILLAFDQRVDYLIDRVSREGSGRGERGTELADGAVAIGRLQLRLDGIGHDKFSKLHYVRTPWRPWVANSTGGRGGLQLSQRALGSLIRLGCLRFRYFFLCSVSCRSSL